MQLEILNEPIIFKSDAHEKKLDAYKKFHTLYAADWIKLDYLTEDFLKDIKKAACEIRKNFDALLVIGIGGSFIGAKAFIDALGTDFPIYFAGNNLDSSNINNILNTLHDKNYAINVISKSGTTLETKLVFDIFYDDLIKKGASLKDSIYITSSKGSLLHKFADENQMKSFIIPDDIGGRYSVFTAVGLLAMAAAGLNIENIASGIRRGKKDFFDFDIKDIDDNEAMSYAYYRHLAAENYALEFISVYEEKFNTFTQWIKQLLCESLAKSGKGLIVSNLIYTQDLHSMGQLLQEGRRNIIETHIYANSVSDIEIQKTYASNDICKNKRTLKEINETAFKATVKAHHEGRVPTCVIKLKELNEENLARLAMLYMSMCVYNAALDEVSPYGQPGVEVYKENIKNILKEWYYVSKSIKKWRFIKKY